MMRKFRFIGTEEQASEYDYPKPVCGEVYSEKVIIGNNYVSDWAGYNWEEKEWEEVFEVKEQVDPSPNFDEHIALRYNEGKPKLSMIDLNTLADCANVLAIGAEKYERDNWKKGAKLSTLLDSMLRHVAALQRGELIDPESKLSHIGHIQANAMMLGCSKNINDL